MEFKKQEHVDTLKQLVSKELQAFSPDESSASDLRYKANLLEIKEILEEGKCVREILVTNDEGKVVAKIPFKLTGKLKKKSIATKKGKRSKKTDYTPEVERFIRKAAKTESLSEIVDDLDKKFGIETNSIRLSKWNWTKGIKIKKRDQYKTPKKKSEKLKSGPKRARGKKATVFTPEVIAFMKKCSKTMIRREAIEKTQVKFGHPFSVPSFAQVACANKIRFAKKEDIAVQCDRKTFELIKKLKHLKPYEIESKIIERTGKGFGTGKIASILRRLEANSDMEIETSTENEESEEKKEDLTEEDTEEDLEDL